MADLDDRTWTKALITTLGEVLSGIYLYEPQSELRQFYDPQGDEFLSLTQRLLRQLWSEGWAVFVRRPSPDDREPGVVLDDAQVAALIEDASWTREPLAGDALNVQIEATDKLRVWWRATWLPPGERLPPVWPDDAPAVDDTA